MLEAKDTILRLVEESVRLFGEAEDFVGCIKAQELRATEALGFLEAAEAILRCHPTYYNELIEHPDFITARRLARTTGAR